MQYPVDKTKYFSMMCITLGKKISTIARKMTRNDPFASVIYETCHITLKLSTESLDISWGEALKHNPKNNNNSSRLKHRPIACYGRPVVYFKNFIKSGKVCFLPISVCPQGGVSFTYGSIKRKNLDNTLDLSFKCELRSQHGNMPLVVTQLTLLFLLI